MRSLHAETFAATNNHLTQSTEPMTHSESTPSTYDYLLSHYGPLLTLKHVAEVMHTTPAGLRMTLARRRQPMAVGLAAARRQLGRRIYFEARCVAEMIDGEPAPTQNGPSEP